MRHGCSRCESLRKSISPTRWGRALAVVGGDLAGILPLVHNVFSAIGMRCPFVSQGSWQMPDWSVAAMSATQWACVGLAAAWLLLSSARAARRSSLNLTSVDGARAYGSAPPTYTTNVAERRQQMVDKGDAYEQAKVPTSPSAAASGIAQSEEGFPWCRWGALARIGAIATAGLNVLVAMVAGLSAGQDVNQMVETVTVVEKWESILSRYWVGFLVAFMIVAVELGRLLIRRRQPNETARKV